MKIIYEIILKTIFCLSTSFRFFSPKINSFHKGHKNLFKKIIDKKKFNGESIWFHVASLGEFEIAKPIINNLKKEISDLKIIITFFSPSGYLNSLDYRNADLISYLPIDTSKNSKKFVEIINPKIAVFIKNDLWVNYIDSLKLKGSIIYSISSKFNNSQFYFLFYGKWFLKKIRLIDYFFVQDETSKSVLKKNNIKNVDVSGDYRFTSVLKILEEDKKFNQIEKFIGKSKCFVAGSIWDNDIEVLYNYLSDASHKSILATHDISPKKIKKLEVLFDKNIVKLSEFDSELDFNKKILIIDSIGDLKFIYRYAYVAYVGGGFYKNSLHNILEPSVFSCPVIIGKNYENFNEAVDLINLGGVFSVKKSSDFSTLMKKIYKDPQFRNETGLVNYNYISENQKKNKKVVESLIKKIRS
ncbi:MAG: glycosyltransferase N-terminal domain-containing protein [Bacteroidota bacterium]